MVFLQPIQMGHPVLNHPDTNLRVISLADLEATAKIRPAGYREEVLSLAAWVSETHYALTHKSYGKLIEKFRGEEAKKTIIAIPRDKWNRAARWLASRAKPGDRGIGDVVQRITDASGISKAVLIARAVKLFGDCGCADRRQRWNAMYPISWCVGCGKIATRICEFNLQFVCGAPLCDNCNHAH